MKKNIIIVSFLLAIIAFNPQNKQQETSANVRLLNSAKMREIITDGVEWFKNAQEQDGHFKYEYEPFLDRYMDDDNIVRQTGALYILGEIFVRDTENKHDLEETIEKAISYFQKHTVDEEFGNKEFKCLLKDESKCTLGGTSLALIGIIDLIEAKPSLTGTYQDLIDGYASYILAMKKQNGGFRNAYYIDGEQSDLESPFGNGEAFLALTRYYKYTDDEEVKNIIDDAFEYFADIYGEKPDNNFYLWGMAAIKDLYEMDNKVEYYEFVKDYTDLRIQAHKNKRTSTHNRCAYIEGVISAYSILEQNESPYSKYYYLEEILFWLTQSENLQVKDSDFLTVQYNYLKSQTLKLKKKHRAVGGFLTDLNEPVQRIDFTQHCLNSFLQKLVDIDGVKL